MVISTNMSAQITSRNLAESSGLLSRSLARLSSGSKLLSPEDDAAGLAVSIRFGAQVSRIGAAVNNLNNAVSYTQTQDGFLGKVSKALDRMSELSVLSQDVTKTNSDRSMYDAEFQTLGSYVSDIATKDFNGVSLFDGTTRAVTTDGEGSSFGMTGFNLSGGAYATGVSGDITTTTSAFTALGNVKSAIVSLTTDRATIGANLARINYTSEQLGVLKTNLNSADSRIKDVDVAEESTNYAKYNILVQASTAMLAQANSQPQGALRLLG